MGKLGLLLAGFGVMVLPIAIRNYMYLGEFSILNLNRYIVVGGIAPFSSHGAERSMERISVAAVFAAQPVGVMSKYVNGLSSNLSALF